MALILDAIAAGEGDRRLTAGAGRSQTERESLPGAYSLDDRGLTTATARGCKAVMDGELVWAH